jgi:hypothetical protein
MFPLCHIERLKYIAGGEIAPAAIDGVHDRWGPFDFGVGACEREGGVECVGEGGDVGGPWARERVGDGEGLPVA